MAAINDLINQITDSALRERIQEEVNKLNKQKKFGLVWEDHIPEATLLYDVPVRRGKIVAIRGGDINDLYSVQKTEGADAYCLSKNTQEVVKLSLDSLVCVAQFGESIYPYLKPVDSVCNAPDSDLWHTLIEADNYHALQLLEYLYAGQVDCIYIDPPYNTGSKDWKYNNDYVDSSDNYRHSKWISMMEKRLRLAKKCLKPRDSALIVTIDDNEYATLTLLLDEIFPGYRRDTVCIQINPRGPQSAKIAVTNEFAIIVYTDSTSFYRKKHIGDDVSNLRKWGSTSTRYEGATCFYPIILDESKKIIGFGSVLDDSLHPTKQLEMQSDGRYYVWPIDSKGVERKWRYSRDTIETIAHRLSSSEGNDRVEILINREDEALKTMWTDDAYNAEIYGTKLIASIIGRNKFSYPKSLYAVSDMLRYFIAGKPNALVLDFFAGSGTTLHAVNLLNAEDNGHRRCIMVTNNEVSNEEAKKLAAKGYKQGDPEWEQFGIANYVTWPRTVCSIKGCDINGAALKGNYLGCDLPMANGFMANAAFFRLGFLDKTTVSIGMNFNELLPILWLKAGAYGSCPTTTNYSDMNSIILPENKMAILLSENAYSSFEQILIEHPEIKTVYINTDYEANFQAMVRGLRVDKAYQLYRDYTDHFRLSHGRQ